MKTRIHKLTKLFPALGFLILVSCKKDYVCQCITTTTAPAYTIGGTTYPQQVTVNSVSNTFTSRKQDAESGCKQGESIRSYASPYESSGQGQTTESTTCELQ